MYCHHEYTYSIYMLYSASMKQLMHTRQICQTSVQVSRGTTVHVVYWLSDRHYKTGNIITTHYCTVLQPTNFIGLVKNIPQVSLIKPLTKLQCNSKQAWLLNWEMFARNLQQSGTSVSCIRWNLRYWLHKVHSKYQVDSNEQQSIIN